MHTHDKEIVTNMHVYAIMHKCSSMHAHMRACTHTEKGGPLELYSKDLNPHSFGV